MTFGMCNMNSLPAYSAFAFNGPPASSSQASAAGKRSAASPSPAWKQMDFLKETHARQNNCCRPSGPKQNDGVGSGSCNRPDAQTDWVGLLPHPFVISKDLLLCFPYQKQHQCCRVQMLCQMTQGKLFLTSPAAANLITFCFLEMLIS